MSLLHFWTLNVVVLLLSMEGKKALGFPQKYLNLCSEDEQRSYGFGTTWGWVINDRIFIFGWTIPIHVPELVVHESSGQFIPKNQQRMLVSMVFNLNITISPNLKRLSISANFNNNFGTEHPVQWSNQFSTHNLKTHPFSHYRRKMCCVSHITLTLTRRNVHFVLIMTSFKGWPRVDPQDRAYLRDESEAFISSSSSERLTPLREDRQRKYNTIPWRGRAHHNERQLWESCFPLFPYFRLLLLEHK